jgi:hypothetical protein
MIFLIVAMLLIFAAPLCTMLVVDVTFLREPRVATVADD